MPDPLRWNGYRFAEEEQLNSEELQAKSLECNQLAERSALAESEVVRLKQKPADAEAQTDLLQKDLKRTRKVCKGHAQIRSYRTSVK